MRGIPADRSFGCIKQMEFEEACESLFSFADEKNITPELPDEPRKMRVHLGCGAGGTAIHARVGPQYGC